MSSPEPTVSVSEALRIECIAIGATLTDKDAALREVARLAVQNPALANVTETVLLNALREREALGTTGFGGGIAIPHCRLDTVREFVMGILTVPRGVAFDAVDDKPVNLIVFIIAPSSGIGAHVQILSILSQALLIPGAITEILNARTTAAARENLLNYVREDEESRDYQSKNLFHVFMQDEELFRDVLQVFVSLGAHSVTVLDAETPSAYLAKVPIFASFWQDKPSNFSRVIVAALSRKLTNEALRRVERITGPLVESRKILITVQELSFTAGALDL